MENFNDIDVASPCNESWDDMVGDNKVRFCSGCEQNVYRLTDMTRTQAEDLVRRAQGGEEVCIRFARRADGTVLTSDCPDTKRRQRTNTWAKVKTVAAAVAGVVSASLSTGCYEADAQPAKPTTGGKALPMAHKTVEPAKTTKPDAEEDLAEKPVKTPEEPCMEMMGAAAPPPPEKTDSETKELLEKATQRPIAPIKRMGRMRAPDPRHASKKEVAAEKEMMGGMAVPAEDRREAAPAEKKAE